METNMRDFKLFFQHLKNLGWEPNTVIDVGVASGTYGLYDFKNAYYILIEPLEVFKNNMEKILNEVRGEFHLIAISDFEGEADFFENQAQLDGSTMNFESIPDNRLRKVKVTTLNALLGVRKLEVPILLKTDIQGQDLAAIKGANELLDKIDVIIMEVSMFGPWGKGPDFVEIIKYMDSIGYCPYDFIGYLTRKHDNALGQVDVVFVKRNGIFRQYMLWQ